MAGVVPPQVLAANATTTLLAAVPTVQQPGPTYPAAVKGRVLDFYTNNQNYRRDVHGSFDGDVGRLFLSNNAFGNMTLEELEMLRASATATIRRSEAALPAAMPASIVDTLNLLENRAWRVLDLASRRRSYSQGETARMRSLLMNEGWDGMGPASNYLLVLSGQGASLLDRNKYERIVGRLLRAFPDRKWFSIKTKVFSLD